MTITDLHAYPYTTIRHNNMLTTHIPDRNVDVSTNLPADTSGICWTGIWEADKQVFRWIHFYNYDRNDTVLERMTPGGLSEAHEAIVAKVKAGLLPPPLPADGLAVQSGAYSSQQEGSV